MTGETTKVAFNSDLGGVYPGSAEGNRVGRAAPDHNEPANAITAHAVPAVEIH